MCQAGHANLRYDTRAGANSSTHPSFAHFRLCCLNIDTFSSCVKRLSNWMKNTRRDKNFPWCRVDGSFNPMQCYGSYCFCVNEKGNEIPGTKIRVSVGRPVCTYTSKRYKYFNKCPLKCSFGKLRNMLKTF